MASEKGMGSLQQEKSGRWTMRVCIKGKRYSRSTGTKDKAKAERFLQRFLAPLGDCCKLDWSQVNMAEGVIQLVPKKTRRHHQRMVTIPIHPALGAALLEREVKVKGEGEQWNCSASPSGPVLPEIAAGYRRSRWWVSHELAKIFKAANIEMSVKLEGRRTRTPEATFHSLRHTFVSLAANAGVPLHIVQSIVGHESTAMTRHYYHESADALRQAVAAIPDFGESARGAPETGGGATSEKPVVPAFQNGQDARSPTMTQGQLEELAKIYSQLKRIFEP